jgi:aerobic-type carbon monoxide dehydrogenase small subunit (CoxS/CutS family)
MPTSVSLTVNGQAATVTVDDPGQPLLYVLRNDLELRGPRFPQSARRSLMAHQRDAQSPKNK